MPNTNNKNTKYSNMKVLKAKKNAAGQDVYTFSCYKVTLADDAKTILNVEILTLKNVDAVEKARYDAVIKQHSVEYPNLDLETLKFIAEFSKMNEPSPLYGNITNVLKTLDANGKELYNFNFDEIQVLNGVITLDERSIEKANKDYFEAFTKLVETDKPKFNDYKIKKLEKDKIDLIQQKSKVKKLFVARKQPKKSKLLKDASKFGLIIAVVTGLFFGGKYLIDNANKNKQPLPGDTNGEVQPQISELEQLNIDLDATIESAKAKFAASGLVVSENDLNAYIYLLNYDTIEAIDKDNTIANDLLSNNLLSNSASENFESLERVMGTIINHNGVLSEKNEKNELSVFEDKLINQSDMIINKNYQSYVANLEEIIYDMRHDTDKTLRQTKIEEANSLIVGTAFYSGINFEMLPAAIKSITSSELVGRFVGFTSEFGTDQYLSLASTIKAERDEAYMNVTGDLISAGICLPEKSK
jgi:hypothetical protein